LRYLASTFFNCQGASTVKGSYAFPDLFGEKEVQASTYTLMKHVDRRVFDMREAIDASTIQVALGQLIRRSVG
jgi:hypothetical protein